MSSHELAPKGPTFEAIALEALSKPLVIQGLAYWRSLCGTRTFPAREQLSPREILRLLTNTILLKVIDGGNDFEFAVVGDEVTRAYRTKLIHRRLSEIAKDIPNAATFWGGVYRDIIQNRKPWAVRFSSGSDGEARFSNAEAVLLPLGPRDDVVDHIITFTQRTLAPW